MKKTSSPSFEQLLLNMCNEGLIKLRTENNPHLKISYQGTGGLVTPKWNIKIYKTGTIVCGDLEVVKSFYEGRLVAPDPNLKLIEIDDSGWGFPLCGILVGLTDGERVITGEIPVSFFKPGKFDRKDYLGEYSRIGMNLLQKTFQASPKTHRVEICTGFVNTKLKEDIRKAGFDVRVVEIKGLLQDTLEDLYKKYVHKKLGQDLAYDPKEIKKARIPFEYRKALKWGQDNAPDQLKSGWKSIQSGQQTNMFKRR